MGRWISYTVHDEEREEYSLVCKGKLVSNNKQEKTREMEKKILLWESCAFE